MPDDDSARMPMIGSSHLALLDQIRDGPNRTHNDSVPDLFEAFCIMQKTGGSRRLEGDE